MLEKADLDEFFSAILSFKSQIDRRKQNLNTK